MKVLEDGHTLPSKNANKQQYQLLLHIDHTLNPIFLLYQRQKHNNWFY